MFLICVNRLVVTPEVGRRAILRRVGRSVALRVACFPRHTVPAAQAAGEDKVRESTPRSNRVGGLPLFERPSSGETTKRPAQLLVPYGHVRWQSAYHTTVRTVRYTAVR